MRTIAIFSAAALICVAAPASAAQGLQPGEWQFTQTLTSPMLPGPQTMTSKHCVKPEEGKDPGKVMAEQDRKSDCKLTKSKLAGSRYDWEMACGNGMHGKGVMHLGNGTMDSEIHMTGSVAGQKLDMLTKMKGKRLGPCK